MNANCEIGSCESRLVKPARLRQGARIGVISPSAPAAGLFPKRTARGVAALRSLGFEVVVPKAALTITDHTAGDAGDRAQLIEDLFADESIDCILSAIGGNHSNQLLRHLDFASISSAPKPLVGYSDLTVLQLAIYSQCRMTTFYGPALLPQFAEYPEPHRYTVDSFIRMVTDPSAPQLIVGASEWTDEFVDWRSSESDKLARKMKPTRGWQTLYPGVASGLLIGGCLTSLMHLRGTPYWPPLEGCILFLETPEGSLPGRGRSVADVDACLTDLELTGAFETVSGLLIGRPYGYHESEHRWLHGRLRGIAEAARLPTIADLDFGHTDPVMTLPIGCQASIDADRCELRILEGAVT